jgi:hypothetical protein
MFNFYGQVRKYALVQYTQNGKITPSIIIIEGDFDTTGDFQLWLEAFHISLQKSLGIRESSGNEATIELKHYNWQLPPSWIPYMVNNKTRFVDLEIFLGRAVPSAS